MRRFVTARVEQACTLLMVTPRSLSLAVGAVAVVAVAWAFLPARDWIGRVSFFASESKEVGGLGALASQFGVSLGRSGEGYPPPLYVEILRSERLLSAAYARCADEGTAPTGVARRERIDAELGVDAEEPEVRAALAVRELQDRISVGAADRSGVVSVQFVAKDSSVAGDVVQCVLDALVTFDREARTNRAAREREFAERRAAELRGELEQAEARKVAFLRANRTVQDSPELQASLQALQREVDLKFEVYSAVAGRFEQARIDEARDTPVLTVIEAPTAPALPAPRGAVTKLLILLVALGCVLAGRRILLGGA